MRIDDYFELVRKMVAGCPAVHSSSVTYDKRSSYQGYIKGTLLFLDSSVLHFREFVDVETSVERYTYAYHYQRGDEFVFRYDNTEHYQELNLSTFPHHKHAGDEANVLLSPAPVLADVLIEIENLVDIS
ncbi:MAG: hypothetical protein JW850_15320 [Thermoflexales bacterium]|nr:hypothetical protein [Thermoflexales bacterium]